MRKPLIVSATAKNPEEFTAQPLYKSLFVKGSQHDRTKEHDFFTNSDFDAIIKTNNKRNIGKFYNKALEFIRQHPLDYDCVIFCHDDISIEDRFLNKKLEEGLVEYDILGLAGGKNITIDHPALWHLMCDQSTWSGAVAHPANETQIFMTHFGPTPSRCLLLDGVFLAMKVPSIVSTPKVKFDENIPCIAHFYDVDFCLTANRYGLKMSTWPIWAVHESPGLDQVSEEFKRGAEYFINKWTT